MDELLKQILSEIKELNRGQLRISEKLDAHIKGNAEEFEKLNSKLDSITNAVAKTMEDITEVKDKMAMQEVEIRVIKGGKLGG